MATELRRRQPHGGALRDGGTNAGGPGRPLSVVRIAGDLGPLEAVHQLSRIVQGAPLLTVDSRKRRKLSYRSVSVQDRIRALEALIRLGIEGHAEGGRVGASPDTRKEPICATAIEGRRPHGSNRGRNGTP